MTISSEVGQIVISSVHERIHAGRSYIASYKSPDASPVADNAQIDFLIIVSSRVAHLSYFIGGNSDIETVLYENPTITNNGTQVPVVGLNRDRTIGQSLVVWRDPTVGAVGDLMLNTFGSWSAGPSTPRPDMEWVLRLNTNYLLRAINRSGGAQPMSMMVHWYEFF